MAQEQIRSLDAEFIKVDIEKDSSGDNEYTKEMSKEFIEAENKLFYNGISKRRDRTLLWIGKKTFAGP